MGAMTWSGLTPDQAMRLDRELHKSVTLRIPYAQVAWDTHVEYSRRCAVLLSSNDLRGALDAAEISAAALLIHERERARELERQARTIVHQDEARRVRSERPRAVAAKARRAQRQATRT